MNDIISDKLSTPYLSYVNDRLYSRIDIQITNTDALNGYGHIRRFCVSVFVLIETCRKCGVSTLDGWRDDRWNALGHRHSWKKHLCKLCSEDGKTFFEAISKTESELESKADAEYQVLFESFDRHNR